ncbi:MAG: chemotaxis protein CheW [Nitrospiraceae bacterium]|nr:MAG: chemotaxis protein CheW [Nitrospiraceae bacterium]
MDIARIRKKLKEKAKKDVAEEKPVQESAGTEEHPAEEDRAYETAGTIGIPEDVTEEKARAPEDGYDPDKDSTDQPESRDELLELLTFSLANEELAFRVAEVEEIVGLQRITMVPAVPEHVFGITSLRGKIIPILSLRKRLGLKDDLLTVEDINDLVDSDSEIVKSGKMIIISGPRGFIGAVIDNVIGVVRVPVDKMLDPPGHLSEDQIKLIEGVVVYEQRFISVIRADETMNIEVA